MTIFFKTARVPIERKNDHGAMNSRFLALAHRVRDIYRAQQDALLIAARVGTAATLAYLVAVALKQPETYWPVLSAVIVARGGARGAGGSATDRLIGTLAGACVGLGASFLHRFGLPEWALIFLAMAPMAFLSADWAAFRAAPMAAMIVLSAASAGKGGAEGFGVAVLRVLDVGLGTLVALFVSYVLLPSNPLKDLRRSAAELMAPLANLLSLAMRPADADAQDKFKRLNARTRRDLRELVIAARQIRSKGGEASETPANQFTAALGRAHSAIVFIARALAGAPVPDAAMEALRPFLRDARARLDGVHHLLRDGTPAGDGTDLNASVAAASARIARETADARAHLEALPFLLQTLRDDLNDLAATAAGLSANR
jgi:uncharacterized membrane protein YccC